MEFILRIFIYLIFLSLFLFANEKVTLQLKWFHQFQFAGYYAAKEKGFYNDVGLDVTIKQRDLSFNNINQVIKNEAQYGVADSILFLYKSKNEPIILVSSIFQHSPSVLITLKENKINSIYDFDHKDMIFYENDTDGFSSLALLKKFDLKPNLIRKRESNDYLKLMNKEVDIVPAYLSNEPFYFKEKGIDINIINPSNYGFDLYGDMLFTNEIEAKNHPQRVKKFRDATIKGWKYALDHKDEIIRLIHEKYNPKKSIKHLEYEANIIEKMINKDSIPIGTIDRGRIQYINTLYKEYGLTSNIFNVKDFIFEDYNNNFTNLNFTEEEKMFLKKHPVLKVQNLPSYPPFNFIENGEPEGYTIDYFKLLGKYVGIKFQFVNTVWNRYDSDLKENKVDIIPHIAVNEKRKNYVEFTNVKHIDYTPALVVNKNLNVKSIDDLDGKTVACLNKTFLIPILQKYYPNIKIKTYSKIVDVLEAVSNGEVDAAIDDLPLMEYHIRNNWLSDLKLIRINNSDYLEKTPLYMGLKKGNVVLKSILEKIENSIPTYEMNSLKSKWIDIKNIDTKNFLLEKNEIKFLKNKKTLYMCVNPNWMPIEGIEKNSLEGIISDYINLFQKQLPITIKLQNVKKWDESLALNKENKCDFIPLVLSSYNKLENLTFSKSYLNFSLVVATKIDKPFLDDISSLSGQKLGITKGSYFKEDLEKKFPNINLIEVSNIKKGLKEVDNENLYGMIDLLPVIGYEIQKSYLGNLKVTGKIDGSWDFSIASNKNEPQLNEIFNKLIDNLSDEDRNQISKKWISVRYQQTVDYTNLFWIIVFFVVIISIIIYKNRTIKEINEEIQKSLDVINENVITSKTDEKGIIIDVSKAFCDVSGYSKKELIGQPHSIVRHEDTPKELFEDMWETINSGQTWEGEIKNKNKNGDEYWVYTKITPDLDKDGNRVFRSIRNEITDKKRVENLSITDELTTLFNKRYFNLMFEKEINRIKRGSLRFNFLIFDVDHFKQYNDNYGHQKGDIVLSSIGKKVSEICKRSSDIPFRIGGEEFVIIFQSKDLEHSLEFAENVRKEIENLKIEHKFSSVSDVITISAGLYSALGEDIKSSHEIYKIADDALYKAKKSGRNRVELVF